MTFCIFLSKRWEDIQLEDRVGEEATILVGETKLFGVD